MIISESQMYVGFYVQSDCSISDANLKQPDAQQMGLHIDTIYENRAESST
jgi:hypothetical protein